MSSVLKTNRPPHCDLRRSLLIFTNRMTCSALQLFTAMDANFLYIQSGLIKPESSLRTLNGSVKLCSINLMALVLQVPHLSRLSSKELASKICWSDFHQDVRVSPCALPTWTALVRDRVQPLVIGAWLEFVSSFYSYLV